jgi:hypothetical protein
VIALVGPPITREAAQAAARHELSKAIYHRNDDPWPVRLFRWLGHWIDRITGDIADHSPGGGAGAVALVLLVVGLVALARWRLGPLQRSHRIGRELLLDATVTAAQHRRDAEVAAAAGDWHAAVVARMRAAGRELEQRGVVEVRPGRTAAELAIEVARELPPIAGDIAAATAVFDAVAYGGRDATRDSYATVVAADDAARRASRAVALA